MTATPYAALSWKFNSWSRVQSRFDVHVGLSSVCLGWNQEVLYLNGIEHGSGSDDEVQSLYPHHDRSEICLAGFSKLVLKMPKKEIRLSYRIIYSQRKPSHSCARHSMEPLEEFPTAKNAHNKVYHILFYSTLPLCFLVSVLLKFVPKSGQTKFLNISILEDCAIEQTQVSQFSIPHCPCVS